jgi:predicted transcriptional regulator
MRHDVELASFDLRYEGHRMKSPAQEARLLISVQERGVENPLEGVDADGKRVLLNGFKRYRCAQRLGLACVPYASLGSDESTGILSVLRSSNEKSLSILEQAQFLDDLVQQQQMSVAEIADTLSRSKSWVTMRLGLAREMSGIVREKVLSGAFPVYSYMYTLRPLMRMNGVGKEDVQAFVSAVSGKKMSVREIGQLAHGYFRGPEWFRNEIDSGKVTLALERMRDVPESPDACSGFEGVLVRDLEILAKYLQRVIGKSQDRRLSNSTRTFRAQATLLLAGILSRMGTVQQTLRALHDRIGEAKGHFPPAPGRNECAADCAPPSRRS